MNGFPQSDDEAASRFRKYKSTDPFPDIPPALLNSADIEDYVRETGMIHPFEPEDLKSGSYEIRLGGKCIYWDEKGKKYTVPLEKEGDKLPLRPNSIAFVTPEPVFRLPDYMALRFNLRIKHVHRGLLLGTGPLIDPGFEGQLLIPLHNLTKNEYTFEYGEGLIWVEFTKLSPYKDWGQVSEKKDRLGKYVVFPDMKKHLSPESYLSKALQDHSSSTIQSSIPDVMLRAQRAAEEAAKSARDAAQEARSQRYWTTGSAIVALIVLVIALATVTYQLLGLIQQVNGLVQDSVSYVRQSSQLLGQEEEKNQALEREIQELRKRLANSSVSSVPAITSLEETTSKDAEQNK